jgi:hypothetical protein
VSVPDYHHSHTHHGHAGGNAADTAAASDASSVLPLTDCVHRGYSQPHDPRTARRHVYGRAEYSDVAPSAVVQARIECQGAASPYNTLPGR